MIALEVYLNGERLSIAGREDLCVLTFFLEAGGACGSETYMDGLPLTGCDVSCAVNGASSNPSSVEDEALEWVPYRKRHRYCKDQRDRESERSDSSKSH